MRQVEKKLQTFIRAHIARSCGSNTYTKEIDGCLNVTLHGNTIAVIPHPSDDITPARISFAGWPTVTTASRLRVIMDVLRARGYGSKAKPVYSSGWFLSTLYQAHGKVYTTGHIPIPDDAWINLHKHGGISVDARLLPTVYKMLYTEMLSETKRRIRDSIECVVQHITAPEEGDAIIIDLHEYLRLASAALDEKHRVERENRRMAALKAAAKRKEASC